MTSVLLVYPFFRGSRDRSRFRFPPLGPAYVAAALREAGHAVELLDCTFLGRDEALEKARAAKAEVVGLYAMATLTRDCLACRSVMAATRAAPTFIRAARQFDGNETAFGFA